MLPRRHRLRVSEDFAQTLRRGQRASCRTVVVHLLPGGDDHKGLARAGLIVARSVGIATVRNKVKRRLRHALRAHVVGLEAGSMVVVRAKPAAAEADYQELSADLARCLERCTKESVTT